MNCPNCQRFNDELQNYCRFCGAPMPQAQRQPQDFPKPYGWASPSSPLHDIAGNAPPQPQQVQPLPPPFQQTPLVQMPQQSSFQQSYRCPRCSSNAIPMTQSKISDGGWVVFIVMMLFCFPLFWIGLMMKEQYRVCPNCFLRMG